MKLRCDVTLDGETRRLLICQGPNELESHLAEKLAACLLFWSRDPVLDASTKTPALAGFEFLPDVLCLDAGGDIALWVECGSHTINKLTKLTRRIPKGRGRVVVLKTDAREAKRLREEVDREIAQRERVEILCWPGSTFKDWLAAVGEKNEIYGEATEASLNVVVNEKPFAVDFERY